MPSRTAGGLGGDVDRWWSALRRKWWVVALAAILSSPLTQWLLDKLVGDTVFKALQQMASGAIRSVVLWTAEHWYFAGWLFVLPIVLAVLLIATWRASLQPSASLQPFEASTLPPTPVAAGYEETRGAESSDKPPSREVENLAVEQMPPLEITVRQHTDAARYAETGLPMGRRLALEIKNESAKQLSSCRVLLLSLMQYEVGRWADPLPGAHSNLSLLWLETGDIVTEIPSGSLRTAGLVEQSWFECHVIRQEGVMPYSLPHGRWKAELLIEAAHRCSRKETVYFTWDQRRQELAFASAFTHRCVTAQQRGWTNNCDCPRGEGHGCPTGEGPDHHDCNDPDRQP